MDYWLIRFDTPITYLLAIIGFVFVLASQIKINSAYSKYRRIKNSAMLTGRDVARRILDANGLSQIQVCDTPGKLTDHYDPSRKILKLSLDIFDNSSVASVAVAAHECGHALQDKGNYTFLKIRTFLVPIVNFISFLGYFGLIVSLIGGITGYLKLSILILFATVLFHLVTLPVELNASKRAFEQLQNLSLISEDEEYGVRKVLGAAAMTYVASLLSTILQLLRLVLMLNRRNRD